MLNFFYDVVQLNRLDWRNYVKQPSPITSALMSKMKIKPEDRPRVKLACIKMMLGLKLKEAQKYQIGGFIDLYLRLNAEEQKEFEEKAAKGLPARQRKEFMQYVTSWEEKGIVKGQTKLIIKQINSRFGELPSELEAQIRQLPEEQLESLGVDFLSFEKADDLRTWLNQQPHNN